MKKWYLKHLDLLKENLQLKVKQYGLIIYKQLNKQYKNSNINLFELFYVKF